MSFQLHVGAATDVGQVRSVNEDSFVTDNAVAAVADGMGGHRGGAVASRIAVETLWEHFQVGSLPSLVDGAVNANTRIIGQAALAPDLTGMGTTMCALGVVVDNGRDKIGIVNVGDSRVYRLRGATFEQITVDHSLVESMVREGRLTPAEAEVHPQRNIVTRALGANPRVEVDEFLLDPVDGDVFLLCSDGLSNEVNDAGIVQILADIPGPEQAAQALVAAANANGGRDNITCVVVEIRTDATSGPAAIDTGLENTTSHVSGDVTEPAAARNLSPSGVPPETDSGPGTSGPASGSTEAAPAAPRWRWWKRS